MHIRSKLSSNRGAASKFQMQQHPQLCSQKTMTPKHISSFALEKAMAPCGELHTRPGVRLKPGLVAGVGASASDTERH